MEGRWAHLSDDLGPEKIMLLRDSRVGLEAIVVIDNTAAGPALGGLRMAPDLTVEELSRLARAMTFKNAAAGLRHGGGKGGIVADPDLSDDEKERLVRAFGYAMRDVKDFIAGPDMGLTEVNMAQLHGETGRVIGLPRVMGGISLDTLGTTGFGVAIATEVAEETGAVNIAGSRVVVQGFGSVGMAAARFLTERGAVVVGVSDSRGGCVSTRGLNLGRLTEFKQSGNPVRDFPEGTAVEGEALVGLECEIWVPAARPDVFTAENAPSVKAKVIVQGANIPATADAEALFHERGVLCIPDFIANAGGVICGAVEYAGGSATEAFAEIEEKIRANTREVLENAAATGTQPRHAAIQLAKSRVKQMLDDRRHF
jgi:glutamate dehydrogenase/leucine dehydrogenase